MLELQKGDIVQHVKCKCGAVGAIGRVIRTISGHPGGPGVGGPEVEVQVIGNSYNTKVVTFFVMGTRKLSEEEAALWLLTEGWK